MTSKCDLARSIGNEIDAIDTTLADEWIAKIFDQMVDADIDGYIFGFTDNMDRALLVLDGVASTVRVGASGFGRYECDRTHFNACRALYAERFPVRPYCSLDFSERLSRVLFLKREYRRLVIEGRI